MGIHDRDYHQPEYESHSTPLMQLPPLTPVVKYLLIANIGIYLLCIIIKPIGNFLYGWLEVDSSTAASSLQLWRLVGYQFLHDPRSVMHLLMNMLGLYFLGPTLERFWHSKKFLIFYLSCGIAGGIYYILLSNLGIINKGVLIGASGAILGMLAACAILFPHFVVILFVFPVPIRIASIILIFIYIINIFTGGQNAGGDAAHLAGMAAGAAYVYFTPMLKRKYQASIQKSWEEKFRAYNELQREVDRILEKVNRQGIGSLTKKEKQTLSEATRLEQMKNKL